MGNLNKKEIHDMFQRIKAGEKEGIEDLYVKYKDLIINISFSIVKDRNIAEEISQNVFLKILKIDKEVFPDNNELSWIYTITKNQTIDYLRKQHTNIDIDSIYEINDENNEIENIVEQDTYNKIIEGLEEKEREIISLKIISGMTFREIGEILEMPTTTVQWKYYKAMHTLELLLSNMALFIITTVIYIKRKNIDNEKQEDIANNETHENIKIDGITSDKIEITTSSQNATTSSYIKESLFGFSMIFLIFTIIFGIIFAKHQQKRKIKRLNNRKG